MGENICKWHFQQGIIFQNIQTMHTVQYQKQTTQSKNGYLCLGNKNRALKSCMSQHIHGTEFSGKKKKARERSTRHA